jgi:hypothetical protein
VCTGEAGRDVRLARDATIGRRGRRPAPGGGWVGEQNAPSAKVLSYFDLFINNTTSFSATSKNK